MEKEERDADIRYGTHASARKAADFIHAELSKQVQAGHVAILPLEAVTSLQNLWLLPVAVIPQVGRRLRLIFDFTCLAPMEAMRFGGALIRILKQVPTAYPRLGPVYLIKVELVDA